VPIRTSPLPQFRIDDPVCICPCGILGYFLRSEFFGKKKENGLRAIRIVCEIHLEVAQTVSDSPVYNIRVQASAHGEAALPLLWRLTALAPVV
jgi:hypothetical protein